MGKKLRFKGDRRGKHVSHHHHAKKVKKSHVSISDSEITCYYVNGEVVTLDQLDLGIFDRCNWTTAVGSMDIQDGLPIMIGMIRDNKVGVLTVTNDEKVTISGEDQLEIKDESTCVNFGPSVDIKSKVNRMEPTLTNQVFIVVDVHDLIEKRKVSLSSTTLWIALKDNKTQKYLSHDLENHHLKLSSTITNDEIFELKYVPTGESNFKIQMRSDSKSKLVVSNDKIRVIEDPDDLLDDLNSFTVRIQLANSLPAKKLMKLLKHQGTDDEDTKVSSEVSAAVKDLLRHDIKVGNRLLGKIEDAATNGKLNEFI